VLLIPKNSKFHYPLVTIVDDMVITPSSLSLLAIHLCPQRALQRTLYYREMGPREVHREWVAREKRKRRARPRSETPTISGYWTNTRVNEETFAEHLRDPSLVEDYARTETKKERERKLWTFYPNVRQICFAMIWYNSEPLNTENNRLQ